MPKIVTVSITTLVDDDVDVSSMANVMFNVVEGPTEDWADADGLNVSLLSAEVTENVEAE